MVHSCHQPEVHAMFANKLIQGSKLKKLLTYAPKNAWAKCVGKMRRQNALAKIMWTKLINFQAYNIYLKTNGAQDSNFI